MKNQIAIIGGGPVGMALAVALSRYNVSSVVLEKRLEPTPVSESRAIIWMPKGIEFLEWIGLLDEFKKHAVVRKNHLFTYKRRRLLSLDFNLSNSKFGYSLNMPQYYSEHLFEQEALKHPELITVIRGVEAIDILNDSHSTIVTTRNVQTGEVAKISSAFTVACDGTKSKIRDILHIELKWNDYGTFSAVADIEADVVGQDPAESWIELDYKRPFGLFNFHPSKWRVIYRVNDNETREEASTHEFADKILRDHFPFIKKYKILWVSCFRLGQGQSSSYFKNRIVLAGDAAHPMGPSAGAGMMVGMLGVWRLAFRLKQLIDQQNPTIINNVLSEYEADQRAGSELIQKANAATFSQIALNKKWKAFLRTIFLKLVSPFIFVVRKIVIADTLTNQVIRFKDYNK